MIAYVYRWSIRPESGLMLELRVTAPNVVTARREVERFIVDHEGGDWTVEHVSRETSYSTAYSSPDSSPYSQTHPGAAASAQSSDPSRRSV